MCAFTFISYYIQFMRSMYWYLNFSLLFRSCVTLNRIWIKNFLILRHMTRFSEKRSCWLFRTSEPYLIIRRKANIISLKFHWSFKKFHCYKVSRSFVKKQAMKFPILTYIRLLFCWLCLPKTIAYFRKYSLKIEGLQ